MGVPRCEAPLLGFPKIALHRMRARGLRVPHLLRPSVSRGRYQARVEGLPRRFRAPTSWFLTTLPASATRTVPRCFTRLPILGFTTFPSCRFRDPASPWCIQPYEVFPTPRAIAPLRSRAASLHARTSPRGEAVLPPPLPRTPPSFPPRPFPRCASSFEPGSFEPSRLAPGPRGVSFAL